MLLALGCKPGVGSSCEKGESRCIDGTRALVCQAGRFIETPCRGKQGCRLEKELTACDVHENRDGDACSTDEEGAAVCVDAATLLACRSGRYVRVACRGQKGCTEAGGHAHCDATLGEAGDPCTVEGKKACSTDGKRVLACSSGSLRASYDCRGERGCSVSGSKLTCDSSVAKRGDACDKLSEGSYACTEDARALLRCSGGEFVPDETCKSGTRCLAEPGSTRCGR